MSQASLSISRRGLANLSLLAALLPVVGCAIQGADDTANVGTLGDAVDAPGFGVDYAWARPSPASIKADGYGFVARYLSYDTTGKNLSAGEAAALEAAGLDVVSNWEWGAQDALQGYDLGVQEAKAAESQALADGMPGGRPIYFSIDFDAQPSQQSAIDAYYDGVASVLGRDRTGAYGGYGVISRLFDAGKITWAWQTYAWSAGQWDPRAQVRQIENGIGPNGEMDKDQSVVADFGQWGPGSPTTPPAPPPPVGPATSKPAPTSGCGTIQPGEGLVNGETYSSCDGRFSLAMQTDGNLVLYRNGAGATWASNTAGSDGYAAIMQGDGNFVLYGHHSNALWNSGTNGHDGATLAVQTDGNLVVYAPGAKPVWDTGTVFPAPPPGPSGCGEIQPGQGLTAGESFSSCGGEYTLAMQTDGNLVLYHNGKGAIWATMTNGKSGYNMWMQGDGNFVLYDTQTKPLWNSTTAGHAGAFLAVQSDGNLVVYASGNKPLWDSGTNGK
jgi:Domain of unknown function (DUF1906)